MGTGRKGVCTARGGSQQAEVRGCGHFKQSRVVGNAKQGTSTQGQCMASRWGWQGCKGLEDAGPWAKLARRKAAWMGRGPPAFLLPRAQPTRLAGDGDSWAAPTKPFHSPALGLMKLRPCVACVPGPTASGRLPAASQLSPRGKDTGNE